MQEKFDNFSVNERILLIMKEKNFNKNSLSKLLGLSQPALKKIENNENLPSFKLLFGLLNAIPDISAEWLLTGKGAMFRSRPDELLLNDLIASQQRTIENLSETIRTLTSK